MNITGLQNLNVDEINCYSLKTNYISNDEINTLKGSNINLTLQSQINTLNQYVSNGSSGGGFFSILATQNTGFIANTYWGFNSGTNPTSNIPLVFSYDFKVNSITFTCLSIPTTQATVYIYKNGSVVYTMPNINALTNTFYNINILFSAGDTFNIFTGVGGGGGQIRATVSCSVNGIVGATPQLSVGTVSSLASTAQPTVSLSGTSLNPVLNFGLVQGIQGVQGDKGDKGDTGSKGAKGDTGEKGATDASGLASGLLALTATGLSGVVSALGFSAVIGDISTLQGQVSTLQGDVGALQGKTQYITTNDITKTTQITSNFQVGTAINPTSFSINNSTGNISNTGDLTIKNQAGNSTLTISANDGSITGNNITVGSAHIDALTTNLNNDQKLLSNSSVVIGALTPASALTSVNLNGIVYINGVALVPFSSASSFFSQW